MATFASLKKFRTAWDILAYLSPFYTPPSQQTSRSAQTAPFDLVSTDEVPRSLRRARSWPIGPGSGNRPSFGAANKSTQVCSCKLKRPKREKVESDSVRSSRITKRSSKKPRRITKCKGLKNSFQTCYQNSVFQCLFNMPEFVGYLDGIHNQPHCTGYKPGLCVVCALKALLDSYADKGSRKTSDEDRDWLQKTVEHSIPDDHAMAEDIKKNLQGDPYPFLRYLLEELELKESSDSSPTLAELFKIGAKLEWTCDECGNVVTQEDERATAGGGFGLSVNIQEPREGLRMMAYLEPSEFKVIRNS